jgi:nitroimidazol reductase NimA-like FMN-containing flavoprotein (pyridoxamine 5'-phosphate oxidase superfamily)
MRGVCARTMLIHMKNHDGLDSTSCTIRFACKSVSQHLSAIQSEGCAMRAYPLREDRTIKDHREMEALLDRMAVGRLALSTEDGPYVIPVNYVYAEGYIYFHSGHKGKKIEALRADPRVCFLVDEPGPQVTWDQGCGISQIYESVMCFGIAEFVERLEEKRKILERMVHEFVPAESPVPLKDKDIENTVVVKIHIEWMTGKANRVTPSHTIISNRFRPK